MRKTKNNKSTSLCLLLFGLLAIPSAMGAPVTADSLLPESVPVSTDSCTSVYAGGREAYTCQAPYFSANALSCYYGSADADEEDGRIKAAVAYHTQCSAAAWVQSYFSPSSSGWYELTWAVTIKDFYQSQTKGHAGLTGYVCGEQCGRIGFGTQEGDYWTVSAYARLEEGRTYNIGVQAWAWNERVSSSGYGTARIDANVHHMAIEAFAGDAAAAHYMAYTAYREFEQQAPVVL